MAHTELGGRSDGLQRDAFLLPPGFHAKNARVLHRLN
jgi:hypothetical protein